MKWALRKIVSIIIIIILVFNIIMPVISFASEECEKNVEKTEDVNNKNDKEEEEKEVANIDETIEDDEEIKNETIEQEIQDNTNDLTKDLELIEENDNSESLKVESEENEVKQENNEEESEIIENKNEEIIEEKIPRITYSTHVQNIGWQDYVEEGIMAGTEGKGLRLEGIKIKIETELQGKIEYSTHIQNIGWQNYVEGGQLSGTTGKSYRLEAIRIKLTDELAEKYDIYYRTHIQNFGWLNWTKNGEKSGSEGFLYRMEAIQIKIVKKGEEINGTGKSFVKMPKLQYSTHIENIGWQGYVNKGEESGTQGLGLRLEGIKIKLEDSNLTGSIKYSTHIQNIGWQNFVGEEQLSGTTGKSLRLEGIKMKLTGELSEYFDIYYRTHVQNMGWIAWAKNGEEAGTEGYSYRLEAIQIQLVLKGENAPGNTRGHFYMKSLERKSIEGIKFVFGNVCAGIDVSEHNKIINWQAVKNVADFAIIRCGYGQNFDYQDDKYFETNIQNCIVNNIPIEVYLYSYADNIEKAGSEADHVIRLCNKYKNYIRKVWYDVEDNSVFNQIVSGGMSRESLGQIVDTFANKLRSSGYDVGLYTYSNALNNYFPSNVKNKYKIWIANYSGNSKDVFETTYSVFKTLYQMWQFTSSGVVNGIVTNVDLNIRF